MAYVEPLQPAPEFTKHTDDGKVHVPCKPSGLYKATRLRESGGSGRGVCINLTDIWRPIDVVPDYGTACPKAWTSDTSVELARDFYVNPFYDKHAYLSFRGGQEE